MRTVLIRLAIALAPLLALAMPAKAQVVDPQGFRMQMAFANWAARWDVQNVSFTAMRGDAVIGQGSFGSYRPDVAVPVASLSKAITGMCVIKLATEKKLRLRDRIGVTLAGYFAANPPASPLAKRITIKELLTHTSGIAYDPTQGSPIMGTMDLTAKNMPEQLKLGLSQPLGSKTYRYNNINYDALGMVIEAVTGEPYEQYCLNAVLAPVGATAELNPPLRILNAYGGWKISVIDYVKFLGVLRRRSDVIKLIPTSWPKTDLGGAYYGPGLLMRPFNGSYIYSHSGAFRSTAQGIDEDFGSYFMMWERDVRFAVSYSPQPPSYALNDLDQVMSEAVAGPQGSSLAEAPPPPPGAPF